MEVENTGITLISDSEAVIAKVHEVVSVKTEIEELMAWLRGEATRLTGGFGHSFTDHAVQYEMRLNQMCREISHVLEIVTLQAKDLEESANCYSVPEQSNSRPAFN